MELVMRRYEAQDRDQVVRLHVEALKAAGAYIRSGHWDDDLNNIEEVYVQHGGDFLVVVDGESLIGMGALRRISDTCVELKRMRVLPAIQGKGIGQMILTRLLVRARELGFSHVILDTTIQQTAAKKLYEKNGFVEVRRGILGGFETIYYEKYF